MAGVTARTRGTANANANAEGKAKTQGKARAAHRQKEALTRLYYRTEEIEGAEDLEGRDEGGVDDEWAELQADQDEGDDPRASDSRERDPFCSQDLALRALSHVIWLWRPPVLLWSVDPGWRWICSRKRELVRRRLEKLFQLQEEYFPFLSSPRDLEGMLLQEWFDEGLGGSAGEGRDEGQEGEGQEDGEPSGDGGARRGRAAPNLASYTLKDLSIFLCQRDGTPDRNPWFPVANLFSGQGQRRNSVPVALEVRWLEYALRDCGLNLKDVGKRDFWSNHGTWLLEAHGDFRRRMGEMLREGLGLDAAPDLSVSEETLKKNILGRWRKFNKKNCARIEQGREA